MGQISKTGEVFRKHVGDAGNRTGLDYRKHSPPVQVGKQRPVHFIEINVLPSSFWDHRSNFGVGERAEQGDNSGKQPDAKKQFRQTQPKAHKVVCHHPRLAENSGADHCSNNNHGGGEQPQRWKQIPFGGFILCGWFWLHGNAGLIFERDSETAKYPSGKYPENIWQERERGEGLPGNDHR